MATLTIRNIDAAVKQRLRVRAARHGRSMTAELRGILNEALARKLVEDGPDADPQRRAVQHAVSGESSKVGGVLAALRRSPPVGADLDLARPREAGRKVEL